MTTTEPYNPVNVSSVHVRRDGGPILFNGEPFPYKIAARPGLMVEPRMNGGHHHILWVPLLHDGPAPGHGGPEHATSVQPMIHKISGTPTAVLEGREIHGYTVAEHGAYVDILNGSDTVVWLGGADVEPGKGFPIRPEQSISMTIGSDDDPWYLVADIKFPYNTPEVRVMHFY